MKKTDKPISISEAKEWKNPQLGKSIFYHQIEFSNGDKGQFSTNVNPQVKFTIGEQVDYTYEQDKNKDGTDKTDKFGNPVMKVDKWKEPFVAGGKVVMTKPSECRSIASSVALKCSRIYLSGKENITAKNIMTLADYFYLYLIADNKIYTEPVSKFEDPNNQIAIQKQTALSEACDYYSNKAVKKEEIISLAKEYYEYISFKSNM